METIRNYVEALFAPLPQTADILKLKIDMLANLEEKYNALRAEGKGEHEAVGLVVASIGSAEELRAELGIENEAAAPAEPGASRQPEIDPALREEYRAYLDRKHLLIAVAVALFILSPIARNFFDGISNIFLLGQFLMFVCIGVGVALIILACRRDNYYKRFFGLGDSDDVQDTVQLINAINDNTSHGGHVKYRLTALFAGVTFPVAAMIYLCMGVLGDLWDPGWLIFPVCGVLTGVVGTVEYFQHTK